MKHRITSLLFAALSTFSSLCAADFLDREVSFSEAEIQRALSKSGVQEKNYGGLISVALLEAPSITLGTPENRAGIAARMSVGVLGNPPIPVSFTGTAGIRYDDQKKAFFLENPVANSVESPALTKENEPTARQAANVLISNYFRTKPVYVLRENGNAQELAARWLLRSIRIETGKVIAVLSPF
jgi:hypothetical protein